MQAATEDGIKPQEKIQFQPRTSIQQDKGITSGSLDLQASSLTEDTIDTECALSMTTITYSYAKFSDNCKNCKIMSSYWVIHVSQIREKYCQKISLFLVTHYLVYQKHGRNYPKTIGCKFLNLKLQDMRKGTSQV